VKGNKKSRKTKNAEEEKEEQTAVSTASSLLTSVDPTITKDPYDEVTDAQITNAIEQLHFEAPDWNSDKPQPDWTDAFWAIPKGLINAYKWSWFQLRWQYRYGFMKASLADSDREYLCRTHFGLSEEHWNNLTETQKQSYLGQPGKWKKKDVKAQTKKTQ